MSNENFSHQVDQLVYQAVFGNNEEIKQSRLEIWQQATAQGIIPASINNLYLAKGAGQIPQSFTVPAMNIRGMTYDTARAAFKAAVEHQVGALIFEIARSEMIYTNQSPEEYVLVLMAAAMREGWSGPLFIQGDHFQAKAQAPGVPQSGELEKIKKLIKEAIAAGFYNIDIDMSTLVDLDRETEAEQQLANIKYTIELIEFIREIEPAGVTVSIGGEIGHIGGKNSTSADFRAYMDGLRASLDSKLVGVSKISIQTGTHHGGIVLADGSLAEINIDFSLLKNLSEIGRADYLIGGTVQHGASTLEDRFFNQFPQSEAIEVHLATGLQNLILDHPDFPQDLLAEMYEWVKENKKSEHLIDQTEEQFIYQLRKKSWAEFKQKTWDIAEPKKISIRDSLYKRFIFFYQQLNVVDTADLVKKFIQPIKIQKNINDFGSILNSKEDDQGLAD